MKCKRVLFVCTGNTCRSPMAKAIFKNMVEKEPALRSTDICVKSAGTISLGRCQATDEAIRVMLEMELDICQNRSTYLDEYLVDWADLILVMEHEHKHYIEEYFPQARERVHLLTRFVGEDGEVLDPFGRGLVAYRQCRDELVALLDKVLRKIR